MNLKLICFGSALLALAYLSGHHAQSMDQMIMMSMQNASAMDMFQDNNDILVELDMMFTHDQWAEIQRARDRESRQGGRRYKRKAKRNTRYRWDQKTIPYQIVRSDMTSRDMQQIGAAISDWNRYTCLNLTPRRRQRNYVQIQNGGGCSSYVGQTGGRQTLNLAPGCRRKGIIIHELGHALGFHHEQTRPDRDSYVTIQRQNIPSQLYYNFRKYPTSEIHDYGVPYDLSSIMHYGRYAFSINGQPTITTRDRNKQHLIGNRNGLSFRDIKLANLMYQCDSVCNTKKRCPGEGFVDKSCRCMCPGSPIKPCGNTTTTGGGVTDKCRDMHANCPVWAMNKACDTHPGYMRMYCKMSCGKCGGTTSTTPPPPPACSDMHRHCGYWKQRGYCSHRSYGAYMRMNCQKSCKACNMDVMNPYKPSKRICKDIKKQSRCTSYKSKGYCEKRFEKFMRHNCYKTCGFC